MTRLCFCVSMMRCTAWCSVLRRASRAWPVVVLITPASTTVTPPGRTSRTPKPVAVTPGSTPITLSAREEEGADPASEFASSLDAEPRMGSIPARTAGVSARSCCWGRSRRRPSLPPPIRLRSRDRLDDVVGDVVVGIDGLNVVLLLQCLDQAKHRRRVLALHLDGRLGHHVDLRFHDRNRLAFQRLSHRFHFIRSSGDLEHFFNGLDVGRARLEGFFENLVLLDALRVHRDQPSALEHPRDATGGAHAPTVLLEQVADFGTGAVLIVRQHSEEDGDAAWPIAFVRDLLVLLAGQLPRPLLDRPFDVVRGHVRRSSRFGCGFEPKVALGITAAVARRHRDFPEDLREELPPLDVRLALLPLDLRPP